MKNRNVTFTILFLVLGCFALLQRAQGVLPAPDGCYPGFTTAEGCNALKSLTSGAGNTGVGWYSLSSDTTHSYNTGVGAGALFLNNADSNTAVGTAAMLLNTSGTANVAVGTDALVYNDSGNYNDAVGAFALFNNINGFSNNAFGDSALVENIHGFANTAIGDSALLSNDATGNGLGNYNTAVGAQALFNNTDGTANTAVGFGALFVNDTGTQNTAVGDSALGSNVDGNFNNAFGFFALVNNVTGNQNTAIGYLAGQFITGDGNVCIGQGVNGTSGENGHTRIRNIGSTPIVGGTTVVVAGTGGIGDDFLGYNASSRRYKEDIEAMDKASERLFALKPVSFRAKGDPTHVRHYGLIAEDVAKVDRDLAVYNPQGQPETLRFDSINAMLLNEFLKEHRKVQKQQAAIIELSSVVAQQQKEFQAAIAAQRKQFEARLNQQDAKIQRVNDRVETNKTAPQLVATDQ